MAHFTHWLYLPCSPLPGGRHYTQPPNSNVSTYPSENDEALSLDVGGSLATVHVYDTVVNGHLNGQGSFHTHTQTQIAGIHQTHIQTYTSFPSQQYEE